MAPLNVTSWTHNPLISKEDAERTLSKLLPTFVVRPFIPLEDLLKIVITDIDEAEVHTINGSIFYFEDNSQFKDRLGLVNCKFKEKRELIL